jgi:hypothetical protein
MKSRLRTSFTRALSLSIILLLHPHFLHAATRPSISVSGRRLMSKVVSITTKDNGNETTVHVLGNGRIPDYMAKTLDSPTRIVVDILNADMNL